MEKKPSKLDNIYRLLFDHEERLFALESAPPLVENYENCVFPTILAAQDPVTVQFQEFLAINKLI